MARTFEPVYGSVQTTNAVQTVIKTYTLVDACVAEVEAWVVAKRPDNADCKRFRRISGAKRTSGGGAVEYGVPEDVVLPSGDATLATASIALDVSGNTVRCLVTGVALTTIDWDCRLNVYTYQP